VFERVRRENDGRRRCSPADNSFVAVDRVRSRHGLGLLLRPEVDGPLSCLHDDFLGRSLGLLGMHAVAGLPEPWLVVAGCPGVRLRAVAEKAAELERPITDRIAWHIVCRTRRLFGAWERAGVPPGDTFVAFDGSLHLFPMLVACAAFEAPSYTGREVWDTLLVDASPSALTQLLFGTLPEPHLPAAQRAAPAAAGLRDPERPIVPPRVAALLGRPLAEEDASGELGAFVRELFPAVYERHRQAYADVAGSIERDGREVERALT